ncbi:MAG: G8 domain-containing protein [Bacteroidales bacterium]|nr:G8 domain-containing protein [Bacteroidales bacterium]
MVKPKINTLETYIMGKVCHLIKINVRQEMKPAKGSCTSEKVIVSRSAIHIALISVMLLLSATRTEAADRYSVASGNWGSTAIWSAASGGPAGASVPVAGDNVYIEGGFTVTLDQNTENLLLLSIAAGSTFTKSSAFAVTASDISVNGTFINGGSGAISVTSMVVNGTYQHAIDGGSLPTAAWAAGSTCLVTGWASTATLNSSFNQPFYNFTWDCPGQAANVSFGGHAGTVNGTFTLISSGSFAIRPAGNPTYGNYVQTGGTYNITFNELGRYVTVLNDFLISGGTFNMSSSTNPMYYGILKVAGDFSAIGGTITESGNSFGSIEFVGTAIQNYSSGGAITELIGFTVNQGAYLQMESEATTVTGFSFILSPESTLGITSPAGITQAGTLSGNIQTSDRSYDPAANYVYNGTVSQVTGTGLPGGLTGMLTINNTGTAGQNTVTLLEPLTTGNGCSVDIVSGEFFALAGYLTLGTTSIINRSGGTMTATVQGDGIYNVNYTGSSMTSSGELSGTGLNDITVGLTGGQTLSLNQSYSPDGNLTVSSGILDLGTYTLSRSQSGGTLSVADGATLKVGGANTLPAGYTTVSLSPLSTVEYSGEAQTVFPETYGNLMLSGTGNKSISPGAAVTVTGDLTSNDLLIIASSSLTSNGSLIVRGTSTGNVTYNRQLRAEDNFGERHFFSSPVSGLSVPAFIAANNNLSQIWEWNEVDATWPTVTTGTFESGKGYNLSQTSGSLGMYSFTGTIVNSATFIATSPYKEGYIDRSSPAAYGVGNETADIWAPGRSWLLYGGGGWNIMGNPFTSAINAETFITVNAAKFDPHYQALYVYDGVNNVYRYVAETVPGYPESGSFGSMVQVGQGFYVLALYNNIQFDFNNTMQEHSTGTPMLKSSLTEDPWPGLQLKVKYGDKESSAAVVYNNNMTFGNDPGYDIGQFSTSSDVVIYTALVEKDNSVNFVRQAIPLEGADTYKVSVGVDTKNGGEVTFSAFTVPLENLKFWLEDRAAGIFTDLTTKSYTVTLPANTYGTGRFYIVASANTPTSVNQPLGEAGLRIWTSYGSVIIKGEVSEKAICEIFNLQGQKIISTNLIDGGLNTVTLPSVLHGVIIVRVTDGVNVATRKISVL